MLAAGPAIGQQGGQPGARPKAEKPAAEKPAAEKPAPEKAAAIGCPSLANYRMLMRGGGAAAAALIADPKADHLGCTALPRGRITGTADRVVLGGQSYACASVQGTTACHWMETAAPEGAAR